MERKEHKEDRWVLECSAFCGRNMSSKAVWPNGWGSGLVICWFQVQDFHSVTGFVLCCPEFNSLAALCI